MSTLKPEGWVKVSQEREREGEEALHQGKQTYRGRGRSALWLEGRARGWERQWQALCRPCCGG